MAGKVTIDLAMRHRLQWFIYLWAHGLRKADEHPTVTPYGCGTLYLFKIIYGVELKTGFLYQLNFFANWVWIFQCSYMLLLRNLLNVVQYVIFAAFSFHLM